MRRPGASRPGRADSLRDPACARFSDVERIYLRHRAHRRLK
jgi:hypothetical protein